MSQETLSDIFSQEAHEKLDKRVLDDPAAAVLLHSIVSMSDGKLLEKYRSIGEATTLLQTHVGLLDVLVSAWKKKSFSEVRNLTILHASDVSSSNLSQTRILSAEEQQKLMVALARPYRGNAVNALYEYLEYNIHQYTSHKHYGQFCSIVQSSGTGKTRILLELSRKGVLLLYINLRPSADKGGFPLRDEIPASILTQACASGNGYRVKCCAFFGAVFKIINEDLSTQHPNHGEGTVKNWNQHMCDLDSLSRQLFFQRLQSAYIEIAKTMLSKMGITGAPDLDLPRLDGILNAFPQGNSSIPEEGMGRFYKDLVERLSSTMNADTTKPKLVIAFDEAHQLQSLDGHHHSTVLLRAIKAYSELSSSHGIWAIFVSTTSRVADFSPPQAMFNSSRVSHGGQLLFPPFCETGWDQYAPPLKSVECYDVAKVKTIMGFGRPLWASLKGAFEPVEIFSLALNKLCGTPSYNPKDSSQALAVLAQRFGLDFCFGHYDAVEHVESAVAGHLRVCISTTDDRIWSYTSYPSEPFLSCAAASLLHQGTDTLIQTFFTLQHEACDSIVDIGQSGELVSRLLWLLAKDFFILREGKSDFHGESGLDAELVHCRMIPVIDYMGFVFGDKIWKIAGIDAKKAFENAYINFSHWVAMDENIRQQETNTKHENRLALDNWTLRHWQRTSGIQCCHNQPLIDKVIPIYFKSSKGHWDSMSQIFISDKARIRKSAKALQNIQRCHESIGGPSDTSKRLPYIAILADLGINKDAELNATFSPLRPRGRNKKQRSTCLRIHAAGLSTNTYPFLDEHKDILHVLQNLIMRQILPQSKRPMAENERDKKQFGKSSKEQHMEWEQEQGKSGEEMMEGLLTEMNVGDRDQEMTSLPSMLGSNVPQGSGLAVKSKLTRAQRKRKRA